MDCGPGGKPLGPLWFMKVGKNLCRTEKKSYLCTLDCEPGGLPPRSNEIAKIQVYEKIIPLFYMLGVGYGRLALRL